MIIYLLDSEEARTWLAGDPSISAVAFGHATNFGIEPRRLQVAHQGAGWPDELNRDLDNVGHTISFSTHREFATYAEAEAFALDLAAVPVVGTLVMLCPLDSGTSAKKRVATDAVGLVQLESLHGVLVRYGFTFRCGAIDADEDESLEVARTADDGTPRIGDDDEPRIAD